MIHSMSDAWVRVEQLRRIPGGIEVVFGIHKGRRGKEVDVWSVTCRGVHETKITQLDGGGLNVYSGSHPAAHQYVARQAELRWPRTCDEAKVLAALSRAHVETVDDWIPFDSYLQINTPYNGSPWLPYFAPVSGSNFICRGPDFLVRAYAKALAAIGERVQVTLRGSRKSKPTPPKVLHFGTSFVVADAFVARHLGVSPGPGRTRSSGRP